MEFQNKLDLEFYNNISEPVIVVDIENKILYCNESSLGFLGIHNSNAVENLNINSIIKFSTFKNKQFIQGDFLKTNTFDTIKASIDTRIYIDIEVDLVLRNIKVGGEEGTLMLFKNIESRNLDFPKKGNKSDIENIGIVSDFEYTVVDKVDSEKFKAAKGMDLSLNFYKAIFASSTTGIVIEEENKIKYINKVAMDIIGRYDDLILGRSLFELVGVEQIQYNDEFLKKQFSIYDSSLNIIERKFLREDGSIVYCEMTPMSFVDEDKICSVFLIRDITKRVKVEEAVSRNRDNYMTLLKLLPFGVFVYTDNKFDIGNEALAKILGMENMNELSDLMYTDIVDSEYIDIFRQMYFDAYFIDKSTEFKEFKGRKKNGIAFDAEIASVGINFSYGRSVVFLVQEVTESKKTQLNKVKLEQAIKFDALKTEFISNMSHELKTPLNIILSTVQVLQRNYENKHDEQLNRYLDLTKVNSYRLLRLINNLIDVTRIDVGNLKMNFRNHNVVAIVEDITMAAVEYVESKGMTLIFDTDVEEKTIGVDRENIERIMLNLLSNAVKFSKDNGEIMVLIHDLGEKVQILVRDNGIGISEEKLDKVFDKFVQGEELFTRSHEGSGVGLSLVKSIVENHGGTVYVKSVLNYGSEFIVELPNILSKNKFTSLDIYNRENNSENNSERIKIEFSDIYK